jgi:hypothetical protein
MSIPGSANPLLLASAAAAPTGYEIERSLRFNSADSSYLSFQPSSAGNRKTWTWAGWVKRTVKNTSTDQMLFTGGTTNSATGFLALDFNSSDKLRLSSATANLLITAAVYRDASAWMHIVLTFDSTQGANADKAKLYVNGSEVTTFDTDGRSGISNQDYGINQAAAHEIGRASLGSNKYLDGYLADVHFIDGQALAPTDFGEFDDNGVWQPIAYAGTYGTNGFHLPFSDNSTAAALGTDTSGNGNTWTVNNISVTAGAGNDSLFDSPTNGTQEDTGAGGQVSGNYATLNPLKKGSMTLSNGNLDIVSTGSYALALGTIGVSSGKWYFESTINNSNTSNAIGIAKDGADVSTYPGANDSLSWVYLADGRKVNGGTRSSYGDSYASGDVIGVALDADGGNLYFYKNGVVQNSGTAAYTGLTSGPYFPCVADDSSGSQIDQSLNFGQRAFAYTAPSGYKALCTTNLDDPTIADGSTAMDVALWTGTNTSAARTISGLKFSPDLVWAKARTLAYSNNIYDTVRGTGQGLYTDSTQTEATNNAFGYISTFTSDGFTGTPGSTDNGFFNETNATYVAWTWDAGTSTVSNTDGSITSSVRANASAGFSVVGYTGDATNNSWGHGLNSAPKLILFKSRNAAKNWLVLADVGVHSGFTVFEGLNTTNAGSDYSSSASASSTTVTIPNTTDWNDSGVTYIAYCFAPVEGYSAFGSYTGNSSTDGLFVYTGFRPRFLLFKRSSTTSDWVIMDTAINPYNVAQDYLRANLSNAENTLTGLDIVSNGFKFRTSAFPNDSSTYIYAAFAESPQKYVRAR